MVFSYIRRMDEFNKIIDGALDRAFDKHFTPIVDDLKKTNLRAKTIDLMIKKQANELSKI